MYQYLLFHKPYGVLPQFTDGSPEPRPPLAGYINIPEVYPVGRLDLDSEGLLFLTDDNWVKHRMLDPEHNHPRTYHVQLEGEITDASDLNLASFFQIEGATVTGEVVMAVMKGIKLEIQKHYRRNASRRHNGHRQRYTRVKITGISVPNLSVVESSAVGADSSSGT